MIAQIRLAFTYCDANAGMLFKYWWVACRINAAVTVVIYLMTLRNNPVKSGRYLAVAANSRYMGHVLQGDTSGAGHVISPLRPWPPGDQGAPDRPVGSKRGYARKGGRGEYKRSAQPGS